jgi:hypothetical protein
MLTDGRHVPFDEFNVWKYEMGGKEKKGVMSLDSRLQFVEIRTTRVRRDRPALSFVNESYCPHNCDCRLEQERYLSA